MRVQSDRLFQAIAAVLPGFRPPGVRKALICEMQAEEDLLQYMQGEVHFAQYGSGELHIEMSSLIPKGRWVTVVLLGKSVDRAEPSQYWQIVERFLQLPHIRRLLPKKARLKPVCLCHPNMTVGVARNALGQRIALIGDMVVSRLYKDGIFSAFVTATALADCILQQGIDRREPADALLAGRAGFPRRQPLRPRGLPLEPPGLLPPGPEQNRLPGAVDGTEDEAQRQTPLGQRLVANRQRRRQLPPHSRRHASPGDGLAGPRGRRAGDAEELLTERLFGLDWADIGRYSTGVPMEHVEKKRREIDEVLGIPPFERPPDIERMYSIRIKADEATILHQLGKFGDADRGYFTPRMVRVHRTAGKRE